MSDQTVHSFDFGGALLQALSGLGGNALVLMMLNLTVTLLVGVIEVAALIAAGGVEAFRPGASGGAAVVLAVIVWLFCFSFQCAFLQAAVAEAVAGDRPEGRSFGASFSQGLRAGLANAGPVGAILMIRGIAVFIASLFFLLPGMFLSVIWTVAAPAQVIEKTGVFGAFSRSIELTQGNWLMVFGFNLVASMVAAVAFYIGFAIVAVTTAVLGAVLAGPPEAEHLGAPVAVAMLTVGGLLYYVLITLFFAAMAAIPAAVYRELRAVKGGAPAAVAAVFS